MLKLFLLEREDVSESVKITFLIAADCEKSARKIASENAIISRHKDFWLRQKKEKTIIITSVTFKASYGASCKEIGAASPDIFQGVLLTRKYLTA